MTIFSFATERGRVDRKTNILYGPTLKEILKEFAKRFILLHSSTGGEFLWGDLELFPLHGRMEQRTLTSNTRDGEGFKVFTVTVTVTVTVLVYMPVKSEKGQ